MLRQDPSGGTEAPRGSTVVITVSDYEEPEESPTPTDTPTPTEAPTDSPSAEPSATSGAGGLDTGIGGGDQTQGTERGATRSTAPVQGRRR